jgi:hemerythrin
MAIEWTPDLAIGIEQIDDEHKALFQAANRLMQAMWDGRGKEETGNLLAFLSDYVVTHFGNEERIMMESSYPGYPEHRKLHIAFVDEIKQLQQKYRDGEITSSSCITVLDETCTWLRNHISKVDMQVGKHVRAR